MSKTEKVMALVAVAAAVVLFLVLRARSATAASGTVSGTTGTSTASGGPPYTAPAGYYWYGPTYLLDDLGPHWTLVAYGSSPR